MAHIAGYSGDVQVTATSCTGVKSWSLDYVVDALETTDFGDSGHRSYIPGLDGWSGAFEGYKNGVPIGIGVQIALILEESTNTTQRWSGSAIITGCHPTVDVEGVVTYNYDFQGTAALTVPTA